MGVASNFSFLSFFRSLQDWYDIYRFAAGSGEYTLLQKDTVININSTNYNFRFRYVGKKLQDETIQTVIGSFNCKKFLIQWKIAYVLGPLVFDLLSTTDSIWIAPGNWIVQDIIPGQYIDNLTILGVPPFSIPGLETKLTDEINSFEEDVETIPTAFSLEQNYPNPFNPSTKIRFTIPSVIASAAKQSQLVSLKVYDVLGNEIETLVNEEKPAGAYEITWNASDLPTGVYFYQLQAGDFIQTKKMVLMR
ncbi:MAG: T9SS type A sorting domain-containing protein [Ignavibacteriaceae bacterium]|nr:T9SS type A sorting domain-containing protein [Ignavibacteriaceae bacterium]